MRIFGELHPGGKLLEPGVPGLGPQALFREELPGGDILADPVDQVIAGIGFDIVRVAGGAPGGDDALGMSISKLTGVGIQWVYLISDLSVLLLSLTYIPFRKIIYSLITVIISGQLVGFVQNFRTNTHGSA